MTPEETHRSAAWLLSDIAEKLSVLESWGAKVRLRHNSVMCDYGYVLPTDDGYVARTVAYLPFDSTTDSDD